MAIKYSSAFESAKTRGIKVLVYGRAGMGKTMLAATAPGRVLFVAIEPGLLSLSAANQKRVYGEDWEPRNIDVAEIESLDDLIAIYDHCQDPEFPYDTLYIDSISEIGEKILARMLKQVNDARQAYGEMQEKCIDMLKKFRDLDGKHVVFVAKEATNKDGAVPLHIPMMPGSKVGPATPYLCDEVFHLNVGKLEDGVTTYRYLQTQPSVEFDAKDRSGALDAIEQPNLTHVIEKILNQ